MKIKKVVSVFVVMALIVGLLASSAFAAPPWSAGKGKMKFTMFSDIDDSMKWAAKAIEKMNLKGVIKGTGKGLFEPGRNVTNLEAVVMAVRIMGWEDTAQSITEIPSKFKSIPVLWASGLKYLVVALENGIITEQELLSFRPNEPAKRWEVAKYIVRALGMEDLAQDSMDARLPFKDASAVPDGAAGYVYVAWDQGIMEGYSNGNFMPNKPVTRAEIAVLIDRADGVVDNPQDGREVTGRVEDIDEDDLKITVALNTGRTTTFMVMEGVSVYKDREYIDFDDMNAGDTVRLLLNDDGKVIFVEVVEEAEIARAIWVRGTVQSVDDDEIQLELRDGSRKALDVSEDIEVFIDHKKADIEDVNEGDYGWFKIRGETLLEINITKTVERGELEDEGIITRLSFGSSLEITLNDSRTYDVDEDVEVEIDGEDADFEALKVGYEVRVKGRGNVVTKIEAKTEESEGFEAKGFITAIDKVGTLWITVAGEPYRVDEAVKVEIDGRSKTFADLQNGYYAEIKGEQNVVTEIKAQTPANLTLELEGEIKIITHTANKVTITVEDASGHEFTYEVSSRVRLRGNVDELDELKPGYGVELKVEKGVIVEIDVEVDKD